MYEAPITTIHNSLLTIHLEGAGQALPDKSKIKGENYESKIN